MSYADKYGHLLETGTPVRTNQGDYGVVSSLFMKNNEQWATVQGPYMTGTKHEFPTHKIWKQDTDVGAQEGGSSKTLSELVNDWKGRQILHGGTWKEIVGVQAHGETNPNGAYTVTAHSFYLEGGDEIYEYESRLGQVSFQTRTPDEHTLQSGDATQDLDQQETTELYNQIIFGDHSVSTPAVTRPPRSCPPPNSLSSL